MLLFYYIATFTQTLLNIKFTQIYFSVNKLYEKQDFFSFDRLTSMFLLEIYKP